MSEEFVSVIIPAYNSKDTITNCIDSVINQTYKNIEIIVIDDGSTDDTYNIINEKYKNTKNLTIYCKKNGGVSSARNYGIKKSKGKWIVFVDADDTIDKNLISKLTDMIDNNTLVGATLRKIYANKLITLNYKAEYSILDFVSGLVKSNIFGGCIGYLFEKEKIHLFDEDTMYMEDTVFLLSYLKNVNKVKYTDSTYNYIYNESSITNERRITKIKKNIKNMNYSLNLINNIITEMKMDYYKELKTKSAILLESEISKINNKTDIKELIKDYEIEKIIKDVSNGNMNIGYKIFYLILKTKNESLILLYIKLRNKVKKIIRG